MDEPAPEAADAWTPDGPNACAGCGAVTAKSDFSKKQLKAGEQQIGGSGGSLEPPGLLLDPPEPLLTHLHTVYMTYSE